MCVPICMVFIFNIYKVCCERLIACKYYLEFFSFRKIKKVKGTTASFMTAPADLEESVPSSEPLAEPILEATSEARSAMVKATERSNGSRSPSPPTLAPVLTPPPPSVSQNHEHAPTLTLVPPGDLGSFVLETAEEAPFADPIVHNPVRQRDLVEVKSAKKSGGSASKKKSSKRSSSSAKSRSRPRPPPSPERSPTPPTPPAVLEPAGEDLGFIYRRGAPASPSPPEPDVRRAKKRPSSSGHSSSRKASAYDVSLAGVENNNTTTKKAANSSSNKSKSGASKATGASSATQKSASLPPPVDQAASSSMGIDLVSHGSSYYFVSFHFTFSSFGS